MTTAREDFLRGLWEENPTLVLILGMCPTLAVTNAVANGITMGLATTFVTVASCVFASLLRKVIPTQVRIAAFVLIIATFVTVADFVLAAVVPTIHKALGPFIALIVVNCIILARQEAFASKNPAGRAFLDALGMGLGFTFGLLLMSTIREVIGSGSFLGVPLFGASYQPWTILALPPGGFLTLGFLLLVVTWGRDRKAKARARAALPTAPPVREVA